METINEKTKNELSIQIVNLFSSLVNSNSFKSLKNSFFREVGNVYFYFNKNDVFEFKLNPVLTFRDVKSLNDFLKKEKELSVKFQDFENAAKIHNLVKKRTESAQTNYFYLYYKFEMNNDEIKVIFSSNTLTFKYELLGVQ